MGGDSGSPLAVLQVLLLTFLDHLLQDADELGFRLDLLERFVDERDIGEERRVRGSSDE
jgi:hypothetical protein